MTRKPRGGSNATDVAVGARIRLRRRQLGLSQSAVAAGLGVTFQQIQKYERGTNRVAASLLVRMAKVLETTVAALVAEDGGAPIEPVVAAQLTTPGAIKLLNAFAAIPRAEDRNALLLAARLLAEGPTPDVLDARPESDGPSKL